MSDKYEYCESCAFGGQNHAICDECDDGDQWEDGIDDSMQAIPEKIIKFYKKEEIELERIAA